MINKLDNPNYILNNFEKEGFYSIDFKNIKENDILIFNIYGIPCHLAIYMGNGLILHHPENDKSVIISDN